MSAIVLLSASSASADGCILLNLSGNQAGCAGETLIYNLRLICDNCACQMATPGGAAIVGPFLDPMDPAFPTAIVPGAPANMPPAGPCSSPITPPCATPPDGVSTVDFQVSVQIPAGATVGTSDMVTVDIPSITGPGFVSGASVNLTTTVTDQDCGGGGDPPGTPVVPVGGPWTLAMTCAGLVAVATLMYRRRLSRS